VAAILRDPRRAPTTGCRAGDAQERRGGGQGGATLLPGHGDRDRVRQEGPPRPHPGGDEIALSEGIFETYVQENLRYSQTVASTCTRRRTPATTCRHRSRSTRPTGWNTACCSSRRGAARPTDVPVPGDKALLTPGDLERFLVQKMKTLGPLPARRTTWRSSSRTSARPASRPSSSPRPATSTGSRPRATRRTGVSRQGPRGEAAPRGARDRHRRAVRRQVLRPRRARRPAAAPRRLVPDRHGGVVLGTPQRQAKIDGHGIWIEELERNPGRLIPEKYRGKHEHGWSRSTSTGRWSRSGPS